MSCLVHSHKYKELEIQTNANLISMSILYKLHLHPIIIPSTSSDTIRLDNTKFKDTDSVDGSMAHEMEAGIFAKVHTQNYSISKTWNPIKTSCQMFSSCLISLTILVICSVRFHSNSSDKSLHSAHGDDNQNSKAAAIRPVPRFNCQIIFLKDIFQKLQLTKDFNGVGRML